MSLLALRTQVGKSEATQAFGLPPPSLCSWEQQEPWRHREYLGEKESVGKLFQATFRGLRLPLSLLLLWALSPMGAGPWGGGCG